MQRSPERQPTRQQMEAHLKEMVDDMRRSLAASGNLPSTGRTPRQTVPVLPLGTDPPASDR